jgi:hypothetical protein
MTNPILEFLRENKRRYRDHQHELCEPIREFVRDYAAMRDALLGLYTPLDEGTSYVDDPNHHYTMTHAVKVLKLAQQALSTAETHRELLQAVREGM